MLVFKNLYKKKLIANLKQAMKREFGFVSFGRQTDGTYNMVTSREVLDKKLQNIFNYDSSISKEITMSKKNAKKIAQQISTMDAKKLVDLVYSEDATEVKLSIKEVGLRVVRAQAIYSLYNPSDKFKTRGDVSDLTWAALLKAWDNEDTEADSKESVLYWLGLDTKASKLFS